MKVRFISSLILIILFSMLIFEISFAGALVYSTYLGGSGEDQGNAIAINSSGNAYITGFTKSINFPTTTGVIDNSYNGNQDIFITKLSQSGSSLIYSTYIGGTDVEKSVAIALDNEGNAYITGYTASTNFPVSLPGPDDTSYSGYTDAFILSLNPTGTGLNYSRYLGGTGFDEGYDIAVAPATGIAYITGYTKSPEFPTTPGAYDTTYSGSGIYNGDIFISKLSAGGDAFYYSTFLGDTCADYACGIAIDSSGSVYLTGYTYSPYFPTTPGVFSRTYNAYGDVFVTKLNPAGTGLVYSTFLGTQGTDNAEDIAVDDAGNAYICGDAGSPLWPVTPGAFDTTAKGWSFSFVTKLNPTASALVYSTFLRGRSDEGLYSIVVDKAGNAYLTGYTGSNDFPTTPGAFNMTINGDYFYDAFITELNATGTELVYSTYLGGTSLDRGQSIAIDTSGNAYVCGRVLSSDFPTTTGAYDTSFNGLSDAFVTKMKLTSTYFNSYGKFTASSDTSHWYWQIYGDGTGAGTLSWASSYANKYGLVKVTQKPGEKGKLTQVFTVSSAGWYTAVANVMTDIATTAKQQKVYLYLQQLNTSNAIVATGNQVIQPGNSVLTTGKWKLMQISFYATGTILGVQVVAINNTNSGVTGSLYLDDIWVFPGGPAANTPLSLTNPSFESGMTGWDVEVYADGTGPGYWSEWSGLLIGSQTGSEKGKISQLYTEATVKNTLGSVMVYSAATSMNNTQKVYLYIYSYDSGYSKVLESGNAILQPGKWTPGEWRQLQFGYTPFTGYNAVQLVAINPTGNPYQAIYFDAVDLKQ